MMEKSTKQTRGTGKERIYKFLIEFIKENGYAPSVREICARTGLSSTATVYNHLRILEMMGKIEIKQNSPRAIKLLDYEYRKVEG
ncbi:MAG: HTH domain-containing protein [Ruminococcus flavefaciens]|nr:HTH domain-containing protein [Ruminococcus flavefaciens]